MQFAQVRVRIIQQYLAPFRCFSLKVRVVVTEWSIFIKSEQVLLLCLVEFRCGFDNPFGELCLSEIFFKNQSKGQDKVILIIANTEVFKFSP